jgi:hypothetical protein
MSVKNAIGKLQRITKEKEAQKVSIEIDKRRKWNC